MRMAKTLSLDLERDKGSLPVASDREELWEESLRLSGGIEKKGLVGSELGARGSLRCYQFGLDILYIDGLPLRLRGE